MSEITPETQALQVVQEPQQVQRSQLNLDELHDQLAFIRQVMAREMKEGQDYGKIPGCGDKPGLFQPGAQKLLMTFKLTPHVKKEVLRELPHPTIFGHREYEFTISVRSNTGREWDGVGTCSTFESKYRYRKSARKCPTCGKETIFKDRNAPYGFYCWKKKDGCGAKFGPDDKAITGQEEGKADNENPAEFWNTVRKMAFKRAIVHASINATNTSELWSQDLEDLPQAQVEPEVMAEPEPPKKPTGIPKPQAKPEEPRATAKYRLQALNKLQAAPGGRNRQLFMDYAMSKQWLRGDQQPEEWPLDKVPATSEAFIALGEDIQRFEMSRHAEVPVP